MSQLKSKPDPVLEERYRQFKAAISGSVLWMTKSEASATFKIPMTCLDRRLKRDGINYIQLRKEALANYTERELIKGKSVSRIADELQVSRITLRKLARSKGIRFSRGGSDRSRREELEKWLQKKAVGRQRIKETAIECDVCERRVSSVRIRGDVKICSFCYSVKTATEKGRSKRRIKD